jgi:hypothetical protein
MRMEHGPGWVNLAISQKQNMLALSTLRGKGFKYTLFNQVCNSRRHVENFFITSKIQVILFDISEKYTLL